MSSSRRRRLVPLALGAVCSSSLLLAGLAVPADASPVAPRTPTGAPGAAKERKGDLDTRAVAPTARAGQLQKVRPGAGRSEDEWRARLGDQAVVQLDALTGTPRMLARLDGFLSGRSTSRARTVVLRYLRRHATELGIQPADVDSLVLRRDYTDVAGIHHLSWTQQAGGFPVFGNGVKANVTKRGEIISIEGAPVANLANQAAALSRTPALTAAESRTAAARDVGGRTADVRVTHQGAQTRWANRDQAQLVWFLTGSGLRLAWSTYVQAGGSLSYQHVIDAGSGAVLYRHDLVDFADGDALVVDNYPGAPEGGKQRRRNLVDAGLITKSATSLTQGRYTAAWSDVNDDNQVNAGETVAVPGRSGAGAQYRLTAFPEASSSCSPALICTWDPAKGGSWRVNREADVTQGFYFTGIYHGYLKKKPFGFSRAAGNFEARDGDAVQLNALDGASTAAGDLPDGAHVDNANMETPPDGTPPTMQMYLFHSPGATDAQDPFLPASSAFDASVILHEYTHGLSNRLVVDASGSSTLASLQAGSMGEAWSDYYAEDYLVHKGLERNTSAAGEVATGRYVTADPLGIRTMPIDCPVGTAAAACTRADGTRGGYTYGDLSTVTDGPEVHASGEVWGQTLWDLRQRLGHTVTGMLVTRAMELSPDDPSFLDMRNAILQADEAVYGGRHVSAVWKTFARRGMGFFAGTTDAGDVHPAENFSRPPGPRSPRASLTGTVTDGVSGAPVAGLRVGIGGHESGFGGDYTALTDANGRYTIQGVAVGTYPVVVAAGNGYLPVTKDATVVRGQDRLDFVVERDWAAASGGASVAGFTGPDFTAYGCGPNQAIDTKLGSGWGSTTGDDAGDPTRTPVPKSVTIRLPQPVALTSVSVDPNATCGDDGSSSTAGYRVETSSDGTTWSPLATGTFTAADRGRLNPLTVPGGRTASFVRFTMLSPQVPDLAASCPAGSYSGCSFMDMSEIVVLGRGADTATDAVAVAPGTR